MMNRKDMQYAPNDTAIKLSTIKIPRDQLPKIMKKYGITADKLVAYQHVGAPDIVKICYTTGELPKDGIQFRVPMEDKPGVMILDRANDGLVFITIYDRGDLAEADFRDDAKWLGYLTRTNGQPAKFVDMVVPLKGLIKVDQYAFVNGDPVWLNPPNEIGLTMVRVDRNSRRITALVMDRHGSATKLVALDVDMVKNKPALLKRPEEWNTLVETRENMIFYSRAEMEGLNTIMVVHFQGGGCRKLTIDERMRSIEWSDLRAKADYYTVGTLPDHDHIVGYIALPDSHDVDLRFAPRTDQTIRMGFDIPS